MTYKTDIIEVNGFPFLGITREDNHRWLLRPSDDCPVDDYEVSSEYNRVFTLEVKESYNLYLESKKETAEEVNAARIIGIKSKAGEIIQSKYSIIWQLNHPRGDANYIEQYAWIDRIRDISNEAEINGTQLGDIIWE